MKFYDYDDNNLLQTAAETTIIWDSANEPTNYKWSQILYDIRRADANQNLFLEPITEKEILDYYADQILSFDALVVQNNRLEKEMLILARLMNNVRENLKIQAMQQTPPFTKNGVANVCSIFELSDGQTITIFFHSPDTTPKKIAPTDNLISYKWVLNKKDITIVVAPERGKDLNVREVCRRIMKLAEKNSAAFARANKKRAEKAQKLADTESEISQLEKQLADLQQQLEIAKVKRDEKELELEEVKKKVKHNSSQINTDVNNIPPPPQPKISMKEFNKNLDFNYDDVDVAMDEHIPLSNKGNKIKKELGNITNSIRDLDSLSKLCRFRYKTPLDNLHNKFFNYLATTAEGQELYDNIKVLNDKNQATELLNKEYEKFALQQSKLLVDNIKTNGSPTSSLTLKEVSKMDNINEKLSTLLLKADADSKPPIFKNGFIDAPDDILNENKENILNILKDAGITNIEKTCWAKGKDTPNKKDWQILIDNLKNNINNITNEKTREMFQTQLASVLDGTENITTLPRAKKKQADVFFKRNLLIRANIIAGNKLNLSDDINKLSESEKKKIIDVAGLLNSDGNAYATNINYASNNNILAYLKNVGATNMTEAEIYALNMYGTSSYKSINQQFRESNNNDPIQNAFSQIITSALDKLPKYDGTKNLTWRGVGFNDVEEYDKFCDEYSKKEIEIKELLSSSYDQFVPYGYIKDYKYKIIITIQSYSGRYVSPFHSATRNKEILYKPNTKFEITSILKNKNNAKISLKEIDSN